MSGKKRWRRILRERGLTGVGPLSANQAHGLAGVRRGQLNEKRVEGVLDESVNDLVWLLGSRKATKAEDCGGIDFVCDLDLGTVYLQVKSSEGAAEHFLHKDVAKRLPIAVVVVSDTASQEKLRTQVLHRLVILREELQCGSLEEVLVSRRMISSIESALKEAINRYGGPITKEMTRIVAGDVSVRLRSWAARTIGFPPSRKLKGTDE